MSTSRTFTLPEQRCSCGKLLYKGFLTLGVVEIKCKTCGTVTFLGQQYQELAHGQYAFLSAIDNLPVYPPHSTPYVVDVTQTALDTLGWTRDELLGKPVRDLDPLMRADDYGDMWALIVARDFAPLTLEVYQPKKGGTFVKARARTMFQKTSTHIYLMTVFDVIEHTEAVGAFNTNRAESTPRPLTLEINASGVCDTAPHEFATMLGRRIAEVINHPFDSFLATSPTHTRREMFNELLQKRVSFRFAGCAFLSLNKTTDTFDAYFLTHHRHDGTFSGYTVTLWR